MLAIGDDELRKSDLRHLPAIDADGRWVGHVDVGASGRADRWADIAVAVMSLEWNFGPGWDAEFFAAYGIEPDPVRQAFYRALWNAT